jgi:hypothetical protein
MAVRALLHYALEVPDQTVGERFYRTRGFHHGSVEVGSVDEIAMGARQMEESGFQPAGGSAAT